MAETFSDEGLDYILGVIPKGATTPATLYLGLFVNGGSVSGPTTVPATSAVLGTSPSGVTEASGTAYARTSIAASTDWGSQAAGTGGRKTVGVQKTCPTVGATPWGNIQGFFITAGSTPSGAGVGIWYANFDDTTTISTATGDIIKITPTWQFNY